MLAEIEITVAKHNMKAPLCIVIPTHGRSELLERTLQSIDRCEKPATYRETWVIENGEQCGAEEVVNRFRDTLGARYHHVSAAGKSAALNASLDLIHEDALVVMFDDDVRLAPTVMTAYADAAQKERSGVVFGGPISIDFEVSPPTWLLQYLPAGTRGWSAEKAGRTDSTAFLGCNWAAYARDLRRIGGFNPDRGPGAETGATGQESEAQRRLGKAGLSGYYVPDAKVWHYVPEHRCSPEWAVDRAKRHGIDTGLSVPSNWFRRTHGIVCRTLWSTLLMAEPALSEQLAFHAKFRRSAWAGFLIGQRHQRSREFRGPGSPS